MLYKQIPSTMKKDYLIKKWLVNKLTDVELKEFEDLDDFNLNTKIVDKAKHFDVPADSAVKSYTDFKENLGNRKKTVIKLKPYQILSRIAALFLIGMSIYYVFFYDNFTTVKTLASQKTTFELPDASFVILNASSKAKYDKKNWNTKREIILEGEAFFKVQKGSKFDVVTNKGTITVLGTQFNVNNRDNYFEVKCFEGVVSVSSNGKTQKLTKGYIYRIFNNNTVLDSITNIRPRWVDNVSSFKAVPLYFVLDEFERQYDVQIIATTINTERVFTGSFANDSLEQALKSITVPFNLTYKKSNSNKISLYKSE